MKYYVISRDHFNSSTIPATDWILIFGKIFDKNEIQRYSWKNHLKIGKIAKIGRKML